MMSTAVLINPEPAAWPEPVNSEALYEVIDGQIVEKPPMGVRANQIAGLLHVHLQLFPGRKNLGWACMEQLFILPLKGRQRQRRPDLSFVSFERWPADRP